MRRVALLCVVLFAACSDPGATRTGAADAAVADAIPDIVGDSGATDTTADTETDSEADSEADTTADTETDTALDTISDTDAEADADTATDAETDAEADTTADTEADAALDTISDTDTEADADTEADTEADAIIDTAVEDTGAEPACGNGVVETGESCDDGASNSDSMPGACRTDCLLPACGDMVVDPDEACDDGNAATEVCTYGLTSCTVCASDCTLSAGATSYCGDGAITGSERCDDGNTVTESCTYGPSFCDVCNASCRLASVRGRTCGDGTADPEEQCDDDNLTTEQCSYGLTSCSVCDSGCLLVAGETDFCGDGVIDSAETCDDGNAIVDGCPYGGASCTVCGTNCRSTAGRVRVCGDGVLDAEEVCDDGNTVTEICAYGELSCTVCDSICALVAGEPQTCGNGTIEAGEECDDGLLNDDLTADACRRDCTLPACGDGTLDSVEACDDGNLSDRDQCTSTCEFGLGRPCAPNGANADCLSGWCSNGFCAPEGMAFIPAGSFTMGSPVSEFGRDAAEEDLHAVTLTRAFYMDLTETTQGAWKALAGPSGMPSWFDGSSACNDLTPDNCPVESIGSTTAAIYANARSAAEGLETCYTLTGCSQTLTGGTWQNGTYNCSGMVLGSLDCNGYRLPTEAEWEYAYRAGTTTSLYNGDATTSTGVDPLAELIAVYLGNAVRARTGPVGQYSPNAWGLYDMAGNVQEWVEDRYTARLRDATDPINTTGSGRVIRGGFYGASASGIRAAYRIWFGINLRDSATGFRLVRTVTPANLR